MTAKPTLPCPWKRAKRTHRTWMITWTLRAQGKFQEAIDIQLRLEREWEQASDPDPYVFEELEHLYRATKDTARADSYAAKLRESRQQQ